MRLHSYEALGDAAPPKDRFLTLIWTGFDILPVRFHGPTQAEAERFIATMFEVAGAGINVNCIAAGGIATAAWDEAAARVPGFMGQIMQMIPAGRIGTIEEYVSLALYLSSDDAGYLMGQIISPNGGMLT